MGVNVSTAQNKLLKEMARFLPVREEQQALDINRQIDEAFPLDSDADPADTADTDVIPVTPVDTE